MKLDKWVEEIKKIPDAQLSELIEAFEVICNWKLFTENFAWTGISSLKDIISAELSSRELRKADSQGNSIKKYVIHLNWQGETHTLYSFAKSSNNAFVNACIQLSKKLGISPHKVRNYFDGNKDNFTVRIVK